MGNVIYMRKGLVHEPPSVADPHTLLLLHGESIEDSSMYHVPLTNDGVTVSTEQSKFGGRSLHFDGGKHIIKFPSQYCEFLDRDFTVDFWIRATTLNGCVFSTLLIPGTGFMIGNGGTSILGSQGNSWDAINWERAIKYDASIWGHWAFVRAGNKALLFKNGKLFGTNAIKGSLQTNRGAMSAIGTNAGNNQPYIGYIDEFRISDVARWSSDFTPPTEPYKG